MALSQMMEHYLSVKDQYKDCVVFYRLGDFYEMFFDDAVRVSQLLGLTLTGRDCGLEERAPMCGVPYHAADEYIAKLVKMGEKVAVCEQLEDPSATKGIVKRGVIKVVTAGTQTDENYLDEKVNNYVCCAFKSENLVALAWSDITTGDFAATEFTGDNAVRRCLDEMLKRSVSEVICNDEMLFAAREYPEVSRGVLPHFSSYPAWAFNFASAERTLLEQFKTKTLSAFSISGRNGAISAAGALLEYLKDTQMHALKNIDSVRFVNEHAFLQLDASAIRNLELVKSLVEGKKYGSLLWLLDKTKTGMGARLMCNILLSPLNDVEEINYRLDGVEELYNATVVRLGLSDLLKEVKDIERLSGKISNNNIMPKDCLALAKSIEVLPNIRFQLSGFNSAIIGHISKNLTDLSEISDMIDRAISEKDTPANLKSGGYIKTGYNKDLDELRNVKNKATDLLTAMEKRERDVTGIRTLRISYNRVFGYFIEVSKSFKDKVPLHYQRRQTLANSERYTTTELKELEEKILTSEETSLKLEEALYEDIKQKLSAKIAEFKNISANIALLDVLVSFAETAKANKYVRPQMMESNAPLVIKDGRHPVVEALSKERFIANDALLDEGENRTLIITGPNMAGKSTYMRQVAIIDIMAHIGCFVPAKSAQIPLTDRIFTRIGASDNLIFDQSTFLVEMIEVATILQNATKNSLLILDEVGRGTSTYDGLSIAWAVIEYLTREVGAKTLFATHYHELTELENKMEGIKNYKIAVKELNGGIVFLRKIMRGGANRSFGIEVASLAGVPAVVTDRAKQILRKVERGDIKMQTADEPQEREVTEVERILKEVDMNNLSPMQAFMLVGDLVEKVNGKD